MLDSLMLHTLSHTHTAGAGPLSRADCVVPTEYLTQHLLRDRLAPVNVSRYHDDTLFYLFYCCPGDQAQYQAAMELYAYARQLSRLPSLISSSFSRILLSVQSI